MERATMVLQARPVIISVNWRKQKRVWRLPIEYGIFSTMWQTTTKAKAMRFLKHVWWIKLKDLVKRLALKHSLFLRSLAYGKYRVGYNTRQALGETLLYWDDIKEKNNR